jgi:TonB family protein
MNGKKILIVDFDEKSVDPLSKLLAEEGHQVFVAKDGEEGLEMCKSEQPDLVILEPMLPKLHGFELCSIITKDMDPKIPVIILTKFYKEQQFKIESTRSFGASAFLSKPFDKKELQSHLADLLSGSSGVIQETSEEEAVEETEIPNSFSAETLQNLEENLEKEEDKVQKNEEQGQAIFEVTPVEKPKASVQKETGNISQEIDDMLQDTLSDFGLVKSGKKAVPKVEELEIEKPQVKAPPEDKVTSVLEELKSEVNIEARIAPEVEESTPPKVEEPPPPKTEETTPPEVEIDLSPEPDKEEIPFAEKSAQKIDDELIQQFETKIASAKTDPPVSEKKSEKKKKSKTIEKTVEKEDAAASKEKETDPDSFFSEYGALEEKPSFFQKLLSKVKSTPPKLLVPIVAVCVIVSLAAVFLLRPKKADNTPVQQASLGVPTIHKTVEDPIGDNTQESLDAETESLTSTDDPANLNEAGDPAQTETEEVKEPEQKPAPQPKSSPPPFQPLTAEEGAETAIQPQVVGEVATSLDEGSSTEDTPPENTGSQESDPPVETEAQTSQPSAPPANQVQTGDLVPIQQVDEPPIVLKRVLPEYPAAARNMQITGTILVNALVDERGNVIQTAVIRGVKGPFGFNEASEEAVKQWRFKPATKDGVKVKVWKQIPISFQREN